MGEATRTENPRLVLLVDHDVDSRRHARHLLELHGLEMVQASNGIAALELVQRLPESFRLVITEIDLPGGLSGVVVAETLRLFRPELPAVCMSSRAAAANDGRRCLTKPLQGSDLQAAVRHGFGSEGLDGHHGLPEACIARARARYAVVGDLVEAAMELARAPEQEA